MFNKKLNVILKTNVFKKKKALFYYFKVFVSVNFVIKLRVKNIYLSKSDI